MSAELSNSPANSPAIPLGARCLTEKVCWPGVEFSLSREDISAATEWTIHENRHAVIIHLSGAINQLETELEGCGATPDPPMAGELWLIPAGHRYASRARGEVVRYAELYLEPDYLVELCGVHELQELAPRAGQFDDFLHRTVRYLAPLMTQTDDISRMMCRTLSQAICLHIFREYGVRGRQPLRLEPAGLTAQAARLLREYIESHLDEQITLDGLAQLAGLNTHNLLHGFRGSFGATPAQYVIAQRLRRARWLLLNSRKDITTIALETGFASHSHFSTAFKTHTGLAPREFRAQSKRTEQGQPDGKRIQMSGEMLQGAARG